MLMNTTQSGGSAAVVVELEDEAEADDDEDEDGANPCPVMDVISSAAACNISWRVVASCCKLKFETN